ncbi:MAG: starch-binding protein, partial [Ruminococcus sp.]|nr:starch-binding protein [Ruminococcus sp.]
MKKSLSQKLNKFKTSPLISIVAILEVFVLICVCTFAWFIFADNNTVDTDVISVEPDSGLEIDFSDANENDYVNIWNYLNEFQFEPVTSLDGRNIFIPTTGTLNAIDTANMKFREATVNDMNSKYINIDFTLTNNGEEAMPVYLSSNSYFNLYDPDTKESVASKAIRIAFYQNDGESGRVTSSLLSKEYDGDTPEDPDDPDSPGDTQNSFYIYFNKSGSNWNDVWIETDYTALAGSNKRIQMTQLAPNSNIYYLDLQASLSNFNPSNFYTWVKFHDSANSNSTLTSTVQLPNAKIEADSMYSFMLDDSGKAFSGSYNGGNGMMLNDPVPYDGEKPNVGGDDEGNSGTGDDNTGEVQGQTTVYFNNTLGWKQPYAYIWRENGNNDEALSAWPGKPMTHISGSIYYYTFNSKYDSIIFNDGNSEGGAVKTQDIYPVKDGYIYMIGNSTGDNEFGWTQEDYVGSVEGGTYPVISPGVSTGFQRPYAPVTQIDDSSGKSKVVVPAFASSIDDYNYGSEHSLFTIEPGQTLPLSMIVWLEGTDPDCTEDVYAGKFIDMKLVFATKDSGDKMYTYRFLDKTKENWIDDKITTDTGVSFKPVIQLYDVNSGKGYQMNVHSDEAGNPTIWQCSAPEALVNSDHIMFRRVNPMNEDEVWNYWDTDGFNDRKDAVVNSTVYFSAFSDGAPTNAIKDVNATEEANAPEKSCGGLWGNHNTKIVTIYDGTEGQWIKNSTKEGTTSVLTMNYTYDNQTVEYKASGSGNDMYYFVVPEVVYSKTNTTRPLVTFKRYYNFDSKHALNSNLNELTYHMKWNGTACDGLFGQITGNTSDKFYWGSDLMYIQARNAVTGKMSGSHLQVHFYANNTGAEVSGTSHYTPIYRNDSFAADNDGYGYACVVPSNKNYYKYRVERCNPSNTSEKWNITPLQDITASGSDTDFQYINSVSKNICTIDYLFLKVYLECSTSYCGDSWDPEIYVFKEGGGEEKAWPGTTMTWSSNTSEGGGTNHKQYFHDVNVSNYDRIIFSNDYDYGNQRRQTG